MAEDFYLHLIQIRLLENNTTASKDVNISSGFGLLAIQREYEQYYTNGRNRQLREELNYKTANFRDIQNDLNTRQKIAANTIWDTL